MPTTAIYARQSLDRHGDALAVTRQLHLCRQFAAEHGWAVTREYVDNDLSATSGKDRPEFARMLADAPERIVVWHIDRLVRLTPDLERVIALGVDVHAVTAGHVDLSNPAGRAVARTVTAWATYEGEQKAERQRASNLQRAQAGRMPTGGRRPFGYAYEGTGRDKHLVIHPEEAQHVRTAARAILDGGTLRGVLRQWDSAGVVTTAGNRWGPSELRRLLKSPRYAGIVTYRGQQYGTDESLAIIDADTHRALIGVLNAPERKRPGRPRQYLLSGVGACSTCGGRLYGFYDKGKDATLYMCESRAHVVRQAPPIDKHVTDVVLAALRHRAQLPWLYAPTSDDADAAKALAAEEQSLRARMNGLSEAFADGSIDAEQMKAGTTRLRTTLAEVEAKRAQFTPAGTVPELKPDDDVRGVWESFDIDQQRSIIRDLVTPVVAPPGRGARTFDPSTITFDWHGREPHVVCSCSHRPDVSMVRERADDGAVRGWAPLDVSWNPIGRTIRWEPLPSDPCCIPSPAVLDDALRYGRLTIHSE